MKFCCYNFTLLKRNEFAITEKKVILMATAAIMADNKIPKKRNNIPASTGTTITTPSSNLLKVELRGQVSVKVTPIFSLNFFFLI
ncbi:MAG: hypothetical protein M3040_14435 [Bacteroidota bacterium]|nr:hypothetical protein [Bacteroidota bacterium]